MDIIDSHCHLHFENYDQDRQAVITTAVAAGVNRIVNVGTSLDDSQKAIDLAASREGLWATVGVHPHDASRFVQDKTNLNRLKKLLNQPKVVAVGEVGLDFYKNYSPRSDQEKTLRLQIEAGLESGLPFVFHIRESFSGFWPIYDEYCRSGQPLKGVIHSFSAPPAELEKAMSRGLHIGLNGLLTYTKEQSWLESARLVPLKNLMLETDAPFLTPLPDRGKRCEPWHTSLVADFLANLRNEPKENIIAAATANTIKLFGLDSNQKLK